MMQNNGKSTGVRALDPVTNVESSERDHVRAAHQMIAKRLSSACGSMFLVAALTVGVGACSDDTGDTPDAAALVPMSQVRLGHAVPRSVQDVVFCVDTGTEVLGPLPNANGVSFRTVSDYIEVPAGSGVAVHAYAPAEINGTCPADSADPVPLASGVDMTLTEDAFYTVLARGVPAEGDGNPPSFCFDPTNQTFDQPCPADRLPSVMYFEDDTVPVADMLKLRITTNTPNIPGIDLCYDLDGSAADGSPTEPLFVGLGYGTVTDYIVREPITTGFLVTTAHIPGMECPMIDFDMDGQVDTIVAPDRSFPLPDPIGTDTFPGSLKTFEAGDVITIFGTGVAPPMGNADEDPLALPYSDAQ